MSLFYKSIKAMLLGSLVALGVSIVVGALIPNDTLTLEMLSRGKPDILDLFVGLFAGAAAAYATARPKVTAAPLLVLQLRQHWYLQLLQWGLHLPREICLLQKEPVFFS